jgi:GT2 family glycosyltransferase
LYETVQATEFIKAGLEVGLARQETIWCIHWGPLREHSREQRRSRQIGLRQKAAVFRQLYPDFISVPVQRLYQHHRGAAGRLDFLAGEFGNGAKGDRVASGDFQSVDPARERLGVVIVAFNRPEVLLRNLRALLPQCEALTGIQSRVVVVDNGSTDGAVEAVRREFPHVTVIATGVNDGRPHGFNAGLRHLGASRYVLVMRHDAELATGTLARMVSYLKQEQSAAGVVASLIHPAEIVERRVFITELVPRRPRTPRRVTFVGTTCALVRGDVFFDVGLYDERFKFLYEDCEWSVRAQRKGYMFTFLPEAKVIHHHDAPFRQNGRATFAEYLVADLSLVYKHGGRRRAMALYWVQRVLTKWLAWRWRNDREALHRLAAAAARIEDIYRRCREENRRPSLPDPGQS